MVQRRSLRPHTSTSRTSNGRHAIELAARGFRVTGVDISEPSIAIARERAEARDVEIEFVQLDMCELAAESEFDALFSFSYLDPPGRKPWRTAPLDTDTA